VIVIAFCRTPLQAKLSVVLLVNEKARVSVTLESGALSRFARIFSGDTGVDPYSTAASDVYQDLFAEEVLPEKVYMT
jgi:hypothetical protein